MISKTIPAALFLAASIAAGTAFAGTGAEGVFTIHNDTENNVVSGFYTSEDDGETWSANWLSIQIRPGESAEARFHETRLGSISCTDPDGIWHPYHQCHNPKRHQRYETWSALHPERQDLRS